MGGHENRAGHDINSTATATGRTGFLGRELLELGTLLVAAGAAHLVVLSLGHSDNGALLMVTVGAVVLLASALHRWRRHRKHRPHHLPHAHTDPADSQLWRLRVRMADVPGGLAALTAAIARLGADIRLMQIHPGDTEVIDELYVTTPGGVTADRLTAAVRHAGGQQPVVEPADIHELSDLTSRTLALVGAMATGTVHLPDALRALSGAHEVHQRDDPPPGLDRDDLLAETMTLTAPGGDVLVLRRDGLPFLPVEYARCRALVQVAASLPARHD